MPFNAKSKLLFIHIPKTAGTSLAAYFGMDTPESFMFSRWDRDRFAFMEAYRHRTSSPRLRFEPQHYTPDLLQELIPDYASYFKFTFVRHPGTRLLSEYFWLRHRHLESYAQFEPDDFHRWCIAFLETATGSHREPQCHYVDSSVDFVGKYENFPAELARLLRQLKNRSPAFVPGPQNQEPRLNSTGLPKEPLLGRIRPETRERIAAAYAEDFERFGYAPQ